MNTYLKALTLIGVSVYINCLAAVLRNPSFWWVTAITVIMLSLTRCVAAARVSALPVGRRVASVAIRSMHMSTPLAERILVGTYAVQGAPAAVLRAVCRIFS